LNRPFVDSNKRVALFATDVFLRRNGWKLKVEADAAYRFLIDLLDRGECDLAHLQSWIRASLKRL